MSRASLRPALRHALHAVAPVEAAPAVPWYLSGGIAPANCIAAYQAIGAASQAASYVNLANPGTNDAALGVAPTWAAETGWTFNGSTQYLNTGVTPAAGWSALARFSGATFVNNATLFGSYSGATAGFLAQFFTSSGDKYRFFNFAALISTTLAANAGVLAIAGATAYVNGVPEAGTMAAGTLPGHPIYLGALRLNSLPSQYFTGNILAFALYDTVLDAATVAALTTAMAAL